MATNTIVLTGGGTAGHVIPHLNLIPLLKSNFDRIIYIGSTNGIERELISAIDGVEYIPIETTKLRRSFSPKNLLIPFKLIKGKNQAMRVLSSCDPCVIFSKGGYVGLPVALASKKMNIPLIAHESDFSIGLANKIAGKSARVVLTTFKDTADRIPNGLFVGPPLLNTEISATEKTRIRQMYNLNTDKPLCLVIGGSLGAKHVNETVWSALDDLLKTHNILHITGKGKTNPNIKRKSYTQIEFTKYMPVLYSIADIAITRGGSNTIFELLSKSIPMIIIPLSKGSRGDQVENALYFEKKGYALCLMEPELNKDSLIEKYNQLLTRAQIMRANTRHAIPRDTLDKIISVLLKYRIQPQNSATKN